MRTFASTTSADNGAAHLFVRSRGSKENAPIFNPTAASALPLQRKAICACGGGCPACQSKPAIQTKLSISAPGDLYEQEADRIADQVMRMPDPSLARSSTDSMPVRALSLQENQRGRESFLDLQEEIEEVDGNAGGQTSCVVGSTGIQLTGNNPTQFGQQSAQSVCGGIGHE